MSSPLVAPVSSSSAVVASSFPPVSSSAPASSPALLGSPATTSTASSPAASPSGPLAPTALPHIDPATLQPFYTQHLAWKPCGGLYCASLTVPIDYAHPSAGVIQLAVSRELTTRQPNLGEVVVNPGGPGASGIQFLQSAAGFVRTQLGNEFDVVSFDPRGVGSSAPIRCLSSAQLDQWVAFEADPQSPSSVAEQDQLAKGFAAGCKAKSGALLAHVSTVDTARDLDVLRAALDQPKLTYMGFSYGTFLGAIYAQLFPQNVRALVLDGAVDPAASAVELDDVQGQGFEVALKSWIASCVTSSKCPVGTSAATAEQHLDAWLATLRTAPIAASGGRTLTLSLAVQGIAAALYTTQDWQPLTLSLTAAMKGNPAGLLTLSDQIDGRQSNGSYDNLIESNMAINCVDRPSLGPISAYAAAAIAGAKDDGPTFGEFIGWGNVACADWPVAAELAPGPIAPVGSPPIMVVGTLRDPATPYRWAQALAKEAKGPLLTYDGDGHTAFLQSSCVDAVVKTFLVSLTDPAPGTTCKDNQ
ncbi:MAG TPA: alpha/beta hydrolase [Acidothermaceae bacterium]|nr:alpha/beta hydrolase [Acidothermaceae bacterium]